MIRVRRAELAPMTDDAARAREIADKIISAPFGIDTIAAALLAAEASGSHHSWATMWLPLPAPPRETPT